MNPHNHLTLRSLAFALDAHAGRLPRPDDPDREPHLPDLTAQLTDLTALTGRISQVLGDLHRTGPQGNATGWRETTTALMEALRQASYGAADLSLAAHHWQPLVQDALRVREPLSPVERAEAYDAVAVQLRGARVSLTTGASVLHSAARHLVAAPSGTSAVAHRRHPGSSTDAKPRRPACLANPDINA
jgi:hypothetical protein